MKISNNFPPCHAPIFVRQGDEEEEEIPGGGFSQMSQEGSSEHGEELSDGALMWIRAMDRMKEMKYVRGKDIRCVPRVTSFLISWGHLSSE